jgi:hypothetical protein
LWITYESDILRLQILTESFIPPEVLGTGMNIGIIPICHDLPVSLIPESLKRIDGAGTTAAVK